MRNSGTAKTSRKDGRRAGEGDTATPLFFSVPGLHGSAPRMRLDRSPIAMLTDMDTPGSQTVTFGTSLTKRSSCDESDLGRRALSLFATLTLGPAGLRFVLELATFAASTDKLDFP